jgi:hypothetical protein
MEAQTKKELVVGGAIIGGSALVMYVLGRRKAANVPNNQGQQAITMPASSALSGVQPAFNPSPAPVSISVGGSPSTMTFNLPQSSAAYPSSQAWTPPITSADGTGGNCNECAASDNASGQFVSQSAQYAALAGPVLDAQVQNLLSLVPQQ